LDRSLSTLNEEDANNESMRILRKLIALDNLSGVKMTDLQ